MATSSGDLPAGQVSVTPTGGGYCLVRIGRANYTREFYLSEREQYQLLGKLGSLLSPRPTPVRRRPVIDIRAGEWRKYESGAHLP